MPRYFLHLFDSRKSVFDDLGADFTDAKAAHDHALWCVRDVIAHDILAEVAVNPESYMSVQDRKGREVCRVYFREVAGSKRADADQ